MGQEALILAWLADASLLPANRRARVLLYYFDNLIYSFVNYFNYLNLYYKKAILFLFTYKCNICKVIKVNQAVY